jgi:hypothetical protein
MRDHRERARAGRRTFRIDLPEIEVELLLEREQLLPADVDHDPRAVDLALALFIGKLAAWPGSA